MSGRMLNRRSIFRYTFGGIALSLFPSRLLAAIRTPSATEGPYYPEPGMRFRDADNDLVRIKGVDRNAGGKIVTLQGRVLDEKGQPVENARVEIWQCDVNGRYLHTAEAGKKPRDAAFQGFGYVVTGRDGKYAFRTIRPVSYPSRAPHIHVKVISGGRELTTQFYIAGEPQNLNDWLYGRMSKPERAAVEMVFKSSGANSQATVDIVV